MSTWRLLLKSPITRESGKLPFPIPRKIPIRRPSTFSNSVSFRAWKTTYRSKCYWCPLLYCQRKSCSSRWHIRISCILVRWGNNENELSLGFKTKSSNYDYFWLRYSNAVFLDMECLNMSVSSGKWIRWQDRVSKKVPPRVIDGGLYAVPDGESDFMMQEVLIHPF